VDEAGIDADPENDEWTAENFARSRPAREVLPEIFGAEVAARMLKPRGRPPAANPKVSTTIRLDADVPRLWRRLADTHQCGAARGGCRWQGVDPKWILSCAFS